MTRYLFNTVTIASTVALAAVLAVFVTGYMVTPWDRAISVSNSVHIGVWSRGLDSRLVFFNDRDYGPYRGSVVALSDSAGNSYPALERRTGWGDSWGVHYRYFQWPDGSQLWTLMVSLWYPVLVFAVTPMAWVWRRYIGASGNASKAVC